uniref:RNA polymerase II-associated factor 1 homolog n=1 Tax=Elaeophora elaphi TaxID=1147741 RepID=A0A0R3S0C3_9BILA
MANLDISGSSSTVGTPRRHPVNGREERPIKTDFLCRVKYSNALPDIPFDTKFLSCPFVSLSRFTDYKSSSLEKNFKFELLCEPDCGVNIDLINPETYYVDPDSPKKHHPIDLELLEDEQANPQNLRRSLQHSKMVPWMRKTEYISSEFTRFGVSAERQETRIGYSTKKKFQTDVLYRDRVSQIAAINKTFDDASKAVSHHPTKKGVTAIEELPLLPDFDNWMHPFALVVFDGDPIPQNDKVDAQTLMPQALIRGMMDEEGEQFVTYFLPSKETLDKRLKDAEKGLEFDSDYVYEYQSIRDYNWLVRNKSTKGYEQDNFLFTIRDGAVYYNELETKVSLNRRKTKRIRLVTCEYDLDYPERLV